MTSGSVDLVVTSPPFLDTVDYAADNWLRAWFCGFNLDLVPIWNLRSLGDWVSAMTGVLRELRRTVKTRGFIVFEVGEVRSGKVQLEEFAIQAGRAAGLDPVMILINSQRFTKTANCWGVHNNTKGTNSNRIVLFQRT